MFGENEPSKERFVTCLAQAFQAHRDPQGFAREILPELRRLLEVQAVSIWMPCPDGKHLQLAWYDNDPTFWSSDLTEIKVPIDTSLAGAVYVTGRYEIVPDVRWDSRHCGHVDEKSGLQTTDMLMIPIRSKGSMIGVMQCINKCLGCFNDRDIALGEAVAIFFAVTLEKSLLLQQLTNAHEKLKETARRRRAALREVIHEKAQLERTVRECSEFGTVIGVSEKMQQTLDLCRRAAACDVTVILVGESGTGKDLLARMVHRNSSRSKGPFIAENCAAIPENLFASELFGHVKGSFSGAERDRVGLIEKAHGGTLFLDEIGDMPASIQKALLRVLETGEVRPVGCNQGRAVDFRLITATHRNLENLVAMGLFREDLYYRINVFRIALPPLRERPQDVPLLASFFMERASRRYGKKLRGIAREALECLQKYPFPGNVRQLKNEIEQAVVLAEEGDYIRMEHLSPQVSRHFDMLLPEGPQGRIRRLVEDVERRAVMEALKCCGGNKTQAAKQLGLSRYGLAKNMKRYGLAGPEKKSTQ